MFLSNVPGWFFVLVLFAVVWNGVHSFIEFRQKKRALDIELYGKNVTAVVHEHNRPKFGLPSIPGAIDSLVTSRNIASLPSPGVATGASVAQVVSPAVSAASAVTPMPSSPSVGSEDSGLPVASPDVVTPIDTLRIPLRRGELLICGYPEPAASTSDVAFRVAFVRVNGEQKMIGTYPADQNEEEVIRLCQNKAAKLADRILRSSAKSGASAAVKRSSTAA